MFLIGVVVAPSVAFAKTPRLDPLADAYPRTKDEFTAAIVIDATTGKELYVFQPEKRWTVASITKLLSSLVVLEKKQNWNRLISLLKRDEVGGGRLRVAVGATMTLRDIFFSSIVGSANNAAMAFARSSGLSSGTFVARMNALAKRLKMSSSHFVDPTGMDPKNVSTARDIAKLATAAFADPSIHEAATTPTYTFTLQRPKIEKTIQNTDKLLTSNPDLTIHGSKTGYLVEAQNNLVVELERNPKESSAPPLLVVVLGSPDRNQLFQSSKALAEWAWKVYTWEGK